MVPYFLCPGSCPFRSGKQARGVLYELIAAAPSARWDNQGLEVLQLVQRAGIHHGAPAASGLPPVCRVALIT